MVGGFGERRIGVIREIGEFLHLLGLSASTEDEETGGEAESEKDEDSECDKKFDHCGSHGAGAGARAVSDDESGDDGHC